MNNLTQGAQEFLDNVLKSKTGVIYTGENFGYIIFLADPKFKDDIAIDLFEARPEEIKLIGQLSDKQKKLIVLQAQKEKIDKELSELLK